MGITTGRSPFILDEQGDNLASVFQGRDMNDTAAVVRVCCTAIRYIAGSTGRCIILNKPGGQIIYESPELNPGEEDTLHWAAPNYLDGVYISQMPGDKAMSTNGRVYVFYH